MDNKRIRSQGGFTLAELTVALMIVVLVATAILGSILSLQSGKTLALHNAQAMNIARGAVETLKGMDFNAVADDVTTVPYDAGPDRVFDTADDFTGTLTVAVRDFLDMDSDGDAAETWIDVDGDGLNDALAKPVRVSFQWMEHLSGQDRNMAVTIYTLVAS